MHTKNEQAESEENPSKGKCRRGSQSNPGGLSFACFSSRLQNCLEDYVEESKC